MSDTPVLVVEGRVHNHLSLGFTDLSRYPAEAQVADVSRLAPQREGQGLRLSAVLASAGPFPEAKYVTLHSSDGRFSASIALADLRDRGILIYQKDGAPLPATLGGPIRFVIPNFDDPCANVKSLGRIELSETPGPDTRPSLTQIQTRKK
jgi:2-dehydropantoate 2-reductase